MKKLIAVCMCLIGFLSMSAKVTYTKSNGGFFGYKYVDQTTFNNGDSHLQCTDPGWTRCKVTPVQIVLPDGGTVIFDEPLFNTIDAVVMRNVTEENPSGSFVFDNQLFVRYSYDVKKDTLIVDVFTLAEARSAGFNI